jgi:hypothetical protein
MIQELLQRLAQQPTEALALLEQILAARRVGRVHFDVKDGRILAWSFTPRLRLFRRQ